MNTKNNQMNQKIIKLVFFTALAIGTAAAAVRQQKPQLATTRGAEERDRRCPLQFDNQKIVFYPHETDCTQYYLCAENGTLVELQCPSGLEFDADFSVCFWPNGSCNNNSVDNVDRDELSMRGIQSVQNNNINNRPSPQKHARCTSEKNGFLFANFANNCKSFFKCQAGYAYQISCGKGLLFNDHTKYCDWAYNVQCKKPEGDGGGSSNAQYQSPNCVGLVDGTMFPNHQSGCKAFYICHHGRYSETRCEGRLVFNERIRACDWPQNVKCACHDKCIGNSRPKFVYTTKSATQASRTNTPIVEHRPSNENCKNNNNHLQVPLCPPQPCPPENCVLQSCIPYNEFYNNHNKL